jgi:hypothetical protein
MMSLVSSRTMLRSEDYRVERLAFSRASTVRANGEDGLRNARSLRLLLVLTFASHLVILIGHQRLKIIVIQKPQ